MGLMQILKEERLRAVTLYSDEFSCLELDHKGLIDWIQAVGEPEGPPYWKQSLCFTLR